MLLQGGIWMSLGRREVTEPTKGLLGGGQNGQNWIQAMCVKVWKQD